MILVFILTAFACFVYGSIIAMDHCIHKAEDENMMKAWLKAIKERKADKWRF